jgi:hypothetical protein
VGRDNVIAKPLHGELIRSTDLRSATSHVGNGGVFMQIFQDSLAKTFDSVQEAFFFKEKISAALREQVASWIAEHQGKPGSYANMFAPMPSDVRNGIHLFTGEVVRSGASLRHVSGEEACRALLLLKPRSKSAQAALARATAGMSEALQRSESKTNNFFCCGTCDPALWRHIVAGGLRGHEVWLSRGMKAMRDHRDGNGKWRRFPFFYTLLALSEIDLPEAVAELRYSAKIGEKYLARTKPSRPGVIRRIAVVERVLGRV